jgi:hypothetical protein
MELRLLLLVSLGLPLVAGAHHSHAEFSGETETIEGWLESIVWRNPHPAMTLRVNNEAGDEEIWRIQVQGNVNGLSRDGVDSEQFIIGERIKISGHLSMRRPAILLATRASLADGSEIILGPDESSGAAIYVGRAEAQRPVEGVEGIGIFRVWTVADRVRTQALPLTDSARAAKAAWDPVMDDPQRGCQPLGMPGAMMSPHPIEIRQDGDNLVLLLEEWGAVRVIHMAENAGADAPVRTLLGRSTGRWEDGTLIVTTTHIDYPYMDEHGTPQSDAAAVVERFSLSADGNSLNWSATVTDPGTLTEPVLAFTTRWDWIPGEEIQAYDCEELDPL